MDQSSDIKIFANQNCNYKWYNLVVVVLYNTEGIVYEYFIWLRYEGDNRVGKWEIPRAYGNNE